MAVCCFFSDPTKHETKLGSNKQFLWSGFIASQRAVLCGLITVVIPHIFLSLRRQITVSRCAVLHMVCNVLIHIYTVIQPQHRSWPCLQLHCPHIELLSSVLGWFISCCVSDNVACQQLLHVRLDGKVRIMCSHCRSLNITELCFLCFVASAVTPAASDADGRLPGKFWLGIPK